jgi:hypothetical protein
VPSQGRSDVLDMADLRPAAAGTDQTGRDRAEPVAALSAPTPTTRAAFVRDAPFSCAATRRVRLVCVWPGATSEGRLMATMRVLLAQVTSSVGTATNRVFWCRANALS